MEDGFAPALLRLLREEAPEAEFRRVLVRALEKDPTARVEELEGDLDAALELRGVLARRRRREEELVALYDTAGDLSSLRDEEHVLQAIVRRGRELLASDVAYLMLIDERRGDTYMRVSVGTRTKAFDHIRLEFGVGLGGLVAQTGTPYVTSAYRSDTRFRHVIDDVVQGESLVSILGVPLALRERVIGVLFAADRRRRAFNREEVALLSSLAAHAAIAIENASLFHETQQALADLRSANRLVSAHNEALERAAEMHERLTALVLRGGGVADVAHAVGEVLGVDLLVLDQEGRPVGGPGHLNVEASDACKGAAPLLLQARKTGRTLSTGFEGRSRCWITPVMAGAELLGALMLSRETLTEADLRMLERAAQVTALLLLNQRALAEAEQRVRGDLLDDLLSFGPRDAEGLHRRACLLGVDLDRPHVLVVVRLSDKGERQSAAATLAGLAAEQRGLAAEYRGDALLVLPAGEAEDPGDLAHRTLARLQPTLRSPVTAGAAGPSSTVTGLRDAYADAVRCVDLLTVLGRQGEAASARELGVYALLFSQAGREEVQGFVQRALGEVIRYDQAHGTTLVETMYAFFACDRSLARAAEALFIHVNTLYQRLDRVAQLVGSEWRRGDPALQMHLALQLHRLTSCHALPQTGEGVEENSTTQRKDWDESP